jgi:hypothetical protein
MVTHIPLKFATCEQYSAEETGKYDGIDNCKYPGASYAGMKLKDNVISLSSWPGVYVPLTVENELGMLLPSMFDVDPCAYL